jgi:hypothetical protein
MRTVTYRCSITHFDVEGEIRDEDCDGQSYIGQSCPACGAIHLIDPRTGKPPSRSKQNRQRLICNADC